MPGCGKSTFGRKAAGLLRLNFIDLDMEISRVEKLSINEIFNQFGEAYFRENESKILKNISSNSDSFIMATGGGAPCYFDNMKFMKASGITIYIRASVSQLLLRLSEKGIEKRPLLKQLSEGNLEQGLSESLHQRKKYYEKSDFILPYHDSLEKDIVKILNEDL